MAFQIFNLPFVRLIFPSLGSNKQGSFKSNGSGSSKDGGSGSGGKNGSFKSAFTNSQPVKHSFRVSFRPNSNVLEAAAEKGKPRLDGIQTH